MIRKKLLYLFFGLYCPLVQAQSVPSSQIYHSLLRLKETRRVLYVAAHPDDENTRLIAYLTNGLHAEVAYLSLTRGDGGQNLIGKELGIGLGQIRTQELLRARDIDGGRQYFTRAIDFGYSKNPDETLQNWNKETILGDVVWAIRQFQPDIVITRFDTVPGNNHGHHTTSAILAGEAFALAGDPSIYPGQLDYVEPWSPKRIFFNAYNFWDEFQPEKWKKYHVFDVGGYDPLLGKTYHQIAADSRTMHKSQGFGATPGIGEARDYIEQVGGIPYEKSPFEGVQNRWETISGGKEIMSRMDRLINDFDFVHPDRNLPGMLHLREMLRTTQGEHQWVREKVRQLDRLIFNSLGLEFELVAESGVGSPGDDVAAELVFNNPSLVPITQIALDMMGTDFKVPESLSDNRTARLPVTWSIPEQMPFSQPYWLRLPRGETTYTVSDQVMIGKPFNDPEVWAHLKFVIERNEFSVRLPLVHQYNDQVEGEIKQPFVVVPEADLTFSKNSVFLVPGAEPVVEIAVNFRKGILEGNLELDGIDSWQYEILSVSDEESRRRRKFLVRFRPGEKGKKVLMAKYVDTTGRVFDQVSNRISYSHIPNLIYFSPATFDLIQEDWKVSGGKIGYIPGAGDEVSEVLFCLGYPVSFIGASDYSLEHLRQFKAIVLGIRAYNTNSELAAHQEVLMDYVQAGGNLIVQYNTSSPLLVPRLGPYPFAISRDRVTVQGSPVTADWDSPVLSSPNPMDESDFQGWVQERGLYFASDVDPRYVTPLTMHDPGERPNKGSLIICKYGKGTYAYSGISFFRQLPAGVPGAIQLFVNLIEQ